MTEADIEKLFIPDTELVKRYQERLAAALNNPASSPQTINMGDLPKVYTELGIKDKELKTNPLTILKALGLKGQNKHNVPKEIMENLLSLIHDPEGVFKSLGNSSNPSSYVAVLNAQSKSQDQIIAILRPSVDGKSFTFIPSVYDKQNFQNFLERTHKESNILYIKDKGDELWGRLQLPPRHNSTPYINSILTKSVIVKRILQKNQVFLGNQGARPLTRAKERTMADEFGGAAPVEEPAEKRANSPEEQAFLNALHQRKVVADALKAGTLACLPGADGYADTEPAVNIANGTRYHGASQLYLKEFQKQNGFPTAEYMTQEAVQKSGIPIRKGEHGVTISFQTKNEESGEWEQKNARLFNVAQSVNPAELKAYAAGQLEEKAQEKIDFLKQQYGGNYKSPERKDRGPAPEVNCSSTEPEKYLGQYLAAVSMGSKFKVTPEQKAEFAGKMESSLFERGANGHTNPFKLSKICNAANDHCKEVIKQARAEQFPQQEQKREQKQGRGR